MQRLASALTKATVNSTRKELYSVAVDKLTSCAILGQVLIGFDMETRKMVIGFCVH